MSHYRPVQPSDSADVDIERCGNCDGNFVRKPDAAGSADSEDCGHCKAYLKNHGRRREETSKSGPRDL